MVEERRVDAYHHFRSDGEKLDVLTESAASVSKDDDKGCRSRSIPHGVVVISRLRDMLEQSLL